MLSPDVAGGNPDLAISQAVNCLTSDFLSSLRADSPSSQSTFVGALLKVDSLVQSCQQSLKEETLDLISSFVSLATLLPSGLRQTESESSSVLNQFSTDVSDMFSELKLTDDVIAPESPPVVSYLEPSCRWLRDNWYNPYPSVEVRSAIARRAKAPRKDVDAWFIDARKRIGWNDLRRRRFDNKRANIVDAAKRFLKSETEALSPEEELPADIENELAAILSKVSSWYEEKYAQSKLARKLDPLVVDMTPELKQTIKDASAARKQQEKAKRAWQGQRPYPTPERSPTSSIADLSVPHDGSPRPNLKRRVCDSSCDEIPLEASQRVCEASNRGDIAFTGLPSPVSSPREETFSTSSSPSVPAVPAAQSTSPTPAPKGNKRKRCLSDSFHYPAAKRPQLRQQAVSDPFPNVSVSGGDWDWLSQSLQDMSNPTFLPPPVSVEAPDPNTPLEIELSNFPAVPALASNELNSSVTESLFTYTTLSYEELPPTLLDGPIDFSVCGFDNIETQIPQIDEHLAITSDLATHHPYVPEFHAGTTDPSQPLPDVLELASTFATEPSTYPPALLASIASFDPNSYVPEDQFWSLFATPPSIDNPFSFGISNTVPSQTPSPEYLSTDDLPPLTDLQREAKQKELEELEARVQAIRAQIAKGP